MNTTNIDYIYSVSSSTDELGYTTQTFTAQYIPFLDYYLVYTVLTFTILFLGFLYFVFSKKK